MANKTKTIMTQEDIETGMYFSMLNRIEKQCLNCNKTIYVHNSVHDRGYGNFCSRKCSGLKRRGMKQKPTNTYGWWIDHYNKG